MAAKRVDVHLSAGEHFIGDERHRVHTLLGSCVSITLWHARWRIGAMSHFLLAARGGAPGPLDARYGDEALALMLSDLAARGVAPADCEAQLFGGADMFPDNHCSLHVGQRNGETARELLDAHGIDVVGHHLFGRSARRIAFDIATGEVWLRRSEDLLGGLAAGSPLVTRPLAWGDRGPG